MAISALKSQNGKTSVWGGTDCRFVEYFSSLLSKLLNIATAPRATLKVNDKVEWSFDGLLQYQSRDYCADETRSIISGVPPWLPNDEVKLKSDAMDVRITTRLNPRTRGNGKLKLFGFYTLLI
jgi:hypothetical protein